MTGFDILPCPGNVLLGWVGGEGAKIVESLPPSEVAKHCTQLLQKFLARPVPAPTRVFRYLTLLLLVF